MNRLALPVVAIVAALATYALYGSYVENKRRGAALGAFEKEVAALRSSTDRVRRAIERDREKRPDRVTPERLETALAKLDAKWAERANALKAHLENVKESWKAEFAVPPSHASSDAPQSPTAEEIAERLVDKLQLDVLGRRLDEIAAQRSAPSEATSERLDELERMVHSFGDRLDLAVEMLTRLAAHQASGTAEPAVEAMVRATDESGSTVALGVPSGASLRPGQALWITRAGTAVAEAKVFRVELDRGLAAANITRKILPIISGDSATTVRPASWPIRRP